MLGVVAATDTSERRRLTLATAMDARVAGGCGSCSGHVQGVAGTECAGELADGFGESRLASATVTDGMPAAVQQPLEVVL